MSWKTKDGQVLQAKDISTTHLINIAKMINRTLRKYCSNTACFYAAGPYPQGEMAQDMYDIEERFWMDDGNEYMSDMDAALLSLLEDHPEINDVISEMENRTITLVDGQIVTVASQFLGASMPNGYAPPILSDNHFVD